jgi:cyclase
MPLVYGGGIKTFEQAQKIFNIGIEKVAINTASHLNLNLISEIAKVYGSQAVIGVIDFKKNLFGKYQIVSNSASNKHKYSISEWVEKLEKAGIGELLITSVDNEGTWNGLDIGLVQQVVSISTVPVIAHGGAGNLEHLIDGMKQGGANAIAMGSMVVYQKKGFGVLINFPNTKQLF